MVRCGRFYLKKITPPHFLLTNFKFGLKESIRPEKTDWFSDILVFPNLRNFISVADTTAAFEITRSLSPTLRKPSMLCGKRKQRRYFTVVFGHSRENSLEKAINAVRKTKKTIFNNRPCYVIC